MIVFGSEYRTAAGSVKPGISAHKLLLGGPAAIAIAPAGLRSNPSVSVNTVGVIDEGDAAARETANSLAAALGATVAEHGAGPVDLLVVGSRPEAPAGQGRSSAPPATTRSRRRPTRCWSSRAAPRSTSRPAAGA